MTDNAATPQTTTPRIATPRTPLPRRRDLRHADARGYQRTARALDADHARSAGLHPDAPALADGVLTRRRLFAPARHPLVGLVR